MKFEKVIKSLRIMNSSEFKDTVTDRYKDVYGARNARFFFDDIYPSDKGIVVAGTYGGRFEGDSTRFSEVITEEDFKQIEEKYNENRRGK